MMQAFRRYMSYILAAFLCICMVPPTAVTAAEDQSGKTMQIQVEITAEGVLPPTPESYTVTLTSQTENAPMPDGTEGDTAELTIEGPGVGVFSFTYNNTGVFLYEIQQKAGSKTNCAYDTTIYDLNVYVTRSVDNSLDINAFFKDRNKEGKPEEALFHNVYSGSAKYDPPIKKVVDAKSGKAPADSKFTFRMTPQDPSYPMPENAEASFEKSTGALTMNVKGPGSYEFGWMYFDESHCGNTYVYTVEEINNGESNYSYDRNIYKLTIKPVPADNGMDLEIFITDEKGDASEMVFTNTYSKKTQEKDKPKKKSSTKTGDENNVLLWGLTAGASVAVIAALLFFKRKNRG